MTKITNSHPFALPPGVQADEIKDLIYFSEYAVDPTKRTLNFGSNGHIYSQERQSANKIPKILNRALHTKKFINRGDEFKKINNCARSAFIRITKLADYNPKAKTEIKEHLQELAKKLSKAPDSYAKTSLQNWILETLSRWEVSPTNLRYRSLSPNQKPSLQSGSIKTILELGFAAVTSKDSAQKAISIAVSPQSIFPKSISELLGKAPSKETLERAASIVCEFYKTVLESKIESSHKQLIITSLSLYAFQAEQEMKKHQGGEEALDKVFADAGVSLPSAAIRPSQS